jgi:single-strand DNA-binding protein
MNETMMTIVGNVVDTPRRRQTKNGHVVTNFRIASTSRRFDREQEKFIDDSTLYITVTCWRGMGLNVDKSIRKGQPVLVYGRYYMREYKVDEQLRTSYELEAIAVGHDLSRGTSEFVRVYQSAPPVTITRDEGGLPADESDHWLDTASPDGPEEAAEPDEPTGAAGRQFATAS